ncbi:unnamed protein product [Allacma fusca]|uniref:Uncharacterized protein n=1 Tax=Allacma fusca TaxID=39272 RepID=A0A8J2KC09_9HEXA|nr:unnamed protein product [Allacma fusca]
MTTTEKHSLWNKLRKVWKEAYPNKPKGEIETLVQKFWKEKKDDLSDVKAKLNELDLKKRSQGTIVAAFLKSAQRATLASTSLPSVQVIAPVEQEVENIVDTEDEPRENNDQFEDLVSPQPIKRKSPAQERLKNEIQVIKTKLKALSHAKSCGLGTKSAKKTIERLEKEKRKKIQELKRLKSCANAMKKCRRLDKIKRSKIAAEHPELLNLNREQYSGRPRLEENQPLLLQTIIDIVSASTSVDPRRRDESLRCCRTLDELRDELLLKGFSLSRSSLYLRLLPKKYNSIEGKRHVNTVPVKIVRAENSARKDHVDSHFAAETMKNLKEIAELFGPVNVFVLSQDDKARVPLGLPAANKQAPILMTLKYRIRLPDHDWVVATKHKLIPSVYAFLTFTSSGNLGYSGPTYIAIRSGKHDSSTAESHCRDFRQLMELETFEDFTSNRVCTERSVPTQRSKKPIVIMMVDGGPDENPRFPKTLGAAISHFKAYDLDAIFIGTNAPHQSAYNPVERRMAPLSHDLSGIILPQEFYGTHLDSQGRTIDRQLEIQNFQKAGEILANVWNNTNIDGFDVISQYIPPDEKQQSFLAVESEEWKADHGVFYLHHYVTCMKESAPLVVFISHQNQLFKFIEKFMGKKGTVAASQAIPKQMVLILAILTRRALQLKFFSEWY